MFSCVFFGQVGKLYKRLQFKKSYVKSLSCLADNLIQAVVNVTFGTGNPADTDIKKMLGDEIKDGSLYDTPVDSSEFDTKFMRKYFDSSQLSVLNAISENCFPPPLLF